MEITRAVCKDLIDIVYLVRETVKVMNAKGMYHWNSAYPGYELILKDIHEKSLFIVKNLGICIGMVTLQDKKIPEYEEVPWQGKDDKVLYVYRLAVHPVWQNKGIGYQLIDYALIYAEKNGYNTVRLDVYSANSEELKIYQEKNFSEVGEILLPYQKTPFKCYEKAVG